MPSMKSSTARQKVCLPATLASLNNDHSSDLHVCCVGVRSSSRPNLVLVRPLRLRSPAWRSSLIVNLSSTVSGHAPTTKVEAHEVVGCCHMVATTLTRSLIWPCKSSVLNCFTFFGFEAREAQFELALLLFGHVDQGFHNSADHLTHVLSHHRGPLGLLRERSLGCDDSCSRLAFYQLVDRKVASGRERHNVFDGCLHLGQQPCVNM